MAGLFEKLESMGFEYTGKCPTYDDKFFKHLKNRYRMPCVRETDVFIHWNSGIDLRIMTPKIVRMSMPIGMVMDVDLDLLEKIVAPYPRAEVDIDPLTALTPDEVIVNIRAYSTVDEIDKHIPELIRAAYKYLHETGEFASLIA